MLIRSSRRLANASILFCKPNNQGRPRNIGSFLQPVESAKVEICRRSLFWVMRMRIFRMNSWPYQRGHTRTPIIRKELYDLLHFNSCNRRNSNFSNRLILDFEQTEHGLRWHRLLSKRLARRGNCADNGAEIEIDWTRTRWTNRSGVQQLCTSRCRRLPLWNLSSHLKWVNIIAFACLLRLRWLWLIHTHCFRSRKTHFCRRREQYDFNVSALFAGHTNEGHRAGDIL